MQKWQVAETLKLGHRNSAMTKVSEPTTKQNAIVLCCTESWLPLAAATLYFCNKQKAAEIADFFVLTYSVSPAQQQQFNQYLAKHNIHCQIIFVDPATGLKQIKSGRFSTATLLRLTLDTIIPKTYRRVLYMDCDVLPLKPLNELFDVEMNDKPIAAVEDYVSLRGPINMISDHPRKIGMQANSRYFNAGVILFDWPKTLREGYLSKATDIIVQAQNTSRNLPFLDQDVLNLSFENNWHILPSRFNLMTFMLGLTQGQPVLRHFNSKNKPWGKTWIPGIGKYKMTYQACLENSPYSKKTFAKFSNMSPSETIEFLVRRLFIALHLRQTSHMK